MIVLVALLALPFARAADCTPSTLVDLRGPLADGEAGVVELEEDAVHAAVARLDAGLRCITEPLAPVDVAAVHRLHAYGFFVRGDAADARATFGAARGADPAWGIPERLAPPGTPLRELFNTASLDVATESVAIPMGTSLLIDGVRTTERPLERPAVMQLLSPSGRVLESVWLTEDQPMPDWSGHAEVVAASHVGPSAHRSPAVWWIAGGAAILAGAGVYSWAVIDHGTYVDLDNGLDEAGLSSLRARANTKVAISGGLGVVGIGLGIVAIRW